MPINNQFDDQLVFIDINEVDESHKCVQCLISTIAAIEDDTTTIRVANRETVTLSGSLPNELISAFWKNENSMKREYLEKEVKCCYTA